MLVFIAIYIIAKRIGEVCLPIKKMTQRKTLIFFFAILMIGFYDGFLDQGQDRFNFCIFINWLGFYSSGGSGKLLNFVSNIVSLITFYS